MKKVSKIEYQLEKLLRIYFSEHDVEKVKKKRKGEKKRFKNGNGEV